MEYPQIARPVDCRRNNAAVRRELYRFLQHQEAVRQYHAAAWEANTGHSEPCDVCKRMKQDMQSTKSLIRHFGGKPR